MIDVRAARADPDTWRAALARKGAAEIFDEFLQSDEAWRAANTRVDELRAARKPAGKGKPSPEEIERLNGLKEELKAAEAALEGEAAKREELLSRIPNPPDSSAPEGFTDDDAVEVRRSGDPPQLAF
jgi:seryl-tRNA synthetase